MNILVETNFILELAFDQEHREWCENIVGIAEAGDARLVIPAFSIAESYENLVRRKRDRDGLSKGIMSELKQLSRSGLNTEKIDEYRNIARFLATSSSEQEECLHAVWERIFTHTHVIPLDPVIVMDAARIRKSYGLELQDSIILSSVLYYLAGRQPAGSCFITKDSHFNDPNIKEEMTRLNCKVLFDFRHAYLLIRACIEDDR